MVELATLIHPRVYQIAAPFENGGLVNCYLIDAPRRTLIDTGTSSVPQASLLPALREMGWDLADLRDIINTHLHIDHAGGNAEMQEVSGAGIHIHKADAAFTERDRYVEKYCRDALRLMGEDAHESQGISTILLHVTVALGKCRIGLVNVNSGSRHFLHFGVATRVIDVQVGVDDVAQVGQIPAHLPERRQQRGLRHTGGAGIDERAAWSVDQVAVDEAAALERCSDLVDTRVDECGEHGSLFHPLDLSWASQSRATAAVHDWSTEPRGSAV